MLGTDSKGRYFILIFAKILALTIKEHMFSQYEWIVNQLHHHNYWQCIGDSIRFVIIIFLQSIGAEIIQLFFS